MEDMYLLRRLDVGKETSMIHGIQTIVAATHSSWVQEGRHA